MFIIPDWPNCSPVWTAETLNWFLIDANDGELPEITIKKILENSENFPIKFPIESVRCKTLVHNVSEDILKSNINSAYPVLHENALSLYSNFLLHKRKFGNASERELYKEMTVLQFVQRLLTKRAVVFVGKRDAYLLLDGTTGFDGWETIGTTNETDKINLQKCLSYDEIKLSVFLSVSSYTHFVNDGNRHNEGIPESVDVESEGIIVGLIGARLEKPKVMEYEEIIITEKQNIESNGYGTLFAPTLHSLFSGFYGVACLTYRQALSVRNQVPTRFGEIGKSALFDRDVYCKRVALSIDTLLIEANQRAKEKNTSAFVHVVGIGLGVWRISSQQPPLFLDTFAKIIEVLGENLRFVSDIVFAYFGENVTCGGFKNGDRIPITAHPNKGIKIYTSQREPHSKLAKEDQGKLLVVSYAWDGNALPGNEFWEGGLSMSGDPAAASSTQISEIHNPHINPKVNAQNLRIAGKNGVVHFKQYCENARQRAL